MKLTEAENKIKWKKYYCINDKKIWEDISREQTLSEDFIREFKDKVDWHYISSQQKLSEDFIREFKDKVNWGFISCHQKLSEDFIREFKDKVDWQTVSWNQDLSEDFIIEFMDNLYFYGVCSNKSSKNIKFSKDFIKKIAHCMSPKNAEWYGNKEKEVIYAKKVFFRYDCFEW